VAVKRGDGWAGVYNHCDSYPTWLGRELWKHLRGTDLKLFAEELLRYDDWRNYLAGGVCPYCGGRGLSQPHSIRGEIDERIPPDYGRNSQYSNARFKSKKEMREYYRSFPRWFGREDEIESMIEEEWRMRQNIRKTGYADPECKYHKHDPLVPARITSEDPDPLFIEWVYVVDPEQRTIDILAHRSDGKTDGPMKGCPVLRDDGYWDYGHCAYRHARVAKVSTDGEEPDWRLIEDIASADTARANLHGKTTERDAGALAEALKGNQFVLTNCIVCGKEVLAEYEPAVHERCRLETIRKLGGDADAWKG
jgi:hypothetical protein